MTLTACPKDMIWGPCGGVNPDGTCEVHPEPCVFLERVLPVSWAGTRQPEPEISTVAGREIEEIRARRPLVVSGFPVRGMLASDVARAAETLRGSVDAVLSGDAGRSRTQFPPSYRAHLMAREGMRVWMGVNARDRNRAALESEIASLREIGVAAVHAVTGDHTRTGDRPDARPVFDLESTSILALARAHGLLTSFAESPAAPPVEIRGARVREKRRAGGMLCLPQYCGDPADLARFVAACADAGARVPIVAGVPLVIDRAGIELLSSFHAAPLPTGYLARLQAADDAGADLVAEGVSAAIENGQQVLAVGGVAGVVVAGGAREGDEQVYARALATVCRELGGGS